MRKIDIQDFQRATRDMPRAVNRRIILNLLREHGPLSRADLARWMDVPRGMITSLVNELLEEELVFEGSTAAAPRGRRPTLLHLRSHDRLALGVDIRSSRTVIQVSDFSGDELARETFTTPEDPSVFACTVGEAVEDLLAKGRRAENLEGVGIVVPGMVDTRTGKVLNAPTLGWRDVRVAGGIVGTRDVPVHVERDAVACALAWIWHSDHPAESTGDFVYVVVSDGVGTGLVVNGQAVRGRHFTAGEFGHLPLDVEGPLCSCGSRGCLESFTSDIATVARYLGLDQEGREAAAAVRGSGIDVATVIRRAREGEREARTAIEATARHLGAGLALVINALDPARIVVGGEIVGAWDLIEPILRPVVEARTLTAAAGRTPFTVDGDYAETRLRGAATLVVAPAFAAPRIA